MLRKIFFLILLSLFLSSCSSNLVGLGGGSSLPVFSSNTDVFSDEQLFTAVIDDDVLSLTGNPHGLDGVFVHNVAYVGVSSWVSVELVPRDPSLSDFWIQGPADAELTKEELVVLLGSQGVEEVDELYVLLYVCRLYDLGDEGFLDLITPAQKGVMEDLFGRDSGYLCGVERFTNDGAINHNLWSLATVDVSGLFNQPVDALCGGNAQEHSFDATSWPNNDFCAQGTLQGSAPSFPEQAGTTTWSCEGIDGGVDIQCSASRSQEVLDCDARRPSHWEQKTTACDFWRDDIDCTSYESVFRGFPGTSNAFRMVIERDKYLALEFYPPEDLPPAFQSSISVDEPQFGISSTGTKIFSISRCPGDFDREKITEEIGSSHCYYRQIFAGGSFLFGGLNSPGTFRCKFEPPQDGSPLYLNIVFTEDVAGTPAQDLEWGCGDTGTRCAARLAIVTVTN